MASDGDVSAPGFGLIIVPKPGELLQALGSGWCVAQAVLESIAAAYTRPKRLDSKSFSEMYLAPGRRSSHRCKAGPRRRHRPGRGGRVQRRQDDQGQVADVREPLYEPLMKDGEKPEDLLDEATISAKAEVMKKLTIMSGQYGGSWTGFVPLLDTEDKQAGITDPDWDGHTYVTPYEDKLAQEDEEEEFGVDIAFWYYRDTSLIYSIRRVADNFFYDFANKTFRLTAAHPACGSCPGPSRPADRAMSTAPGYRVSLTTASTWSRSAIPRPTTWSSASWRCS